MPQRRIAFLLVPCLLYGLRPGCLQGRELQIAVAGSYLPVARSIGKSFAKQGRHRLHWISDSTGNLFAQIQNGAPFDAFLAADLEHPIALLRKGRALPESLFVYERGRLVFWANNRVKLNKYNFRKKIHGERLASDNAFWSAVLLEGHKAIAVPNPRLAPFGRAARSFLFRQGLWQKLSANKRILYASGVSQAFLYVRSGASEAGFISLRQLLSLPKKERGFFYLIPEKDHPPILQAAVILQDSPEIREFWNFFRKASLRSVSKSSSIGRLSIFTKKETQEDSLFPSMGREKNALPKIRQRQAQAENQKRPGYKEDKKLERYNVEKSIFVLQKSDWQALFLSLRLAAFTSLILLFVATPLAWLLSLLRWRSNLASLRLILDAALTLPLVLPPTVLGFYFLLLFGGQGEGGLAFSFGGILVGSCIYSLPFAVQPLRDAFAGIGRRPLEAAASCKASPWDTFFSIVLPMSRGGYLSAAVLSFAHTLGEFGVVLMLGGSIPGETRVASIAIFEHAEALEYGRAHALALYLLAISFLLIFFLYAFRHRSDLRNGKFPR